MSENSKADKQLCRMITPEFRVAFPHVFEPHAPQGKGTPKFSITMLFPKILNGRDNPLMGSTLDGEPRSIKDIIRNAKLAKFGPKESWPKDLKAQIGDGDIPPKGKDKPIDGFAGHWSIKATSSSESRPGVLNFDMTPITEPHLLYPGCFARAYVFAYVWTYMNEQKVGFILDGVQKLRDGQSFGGKMPLEKVFRPVPQNVSEDSIGDDSEAPF